MSAKSKIFFRSRYQPFLLGFHSENLRSGFSMLRWLRDPRSEKRGLPGKQSFHWFDPEYEHPRSFSRINWPRASQRRLLSRTEP